MVLLRARTSLEAHMYLDLHPCDCGDVQFERSSAVVMTEEGLASRYTGSCATCGTPRECLFLLPDEIEMPDPASVRFGGEEPSSIIDAGEWLYVADLYARARATQATVLAAAAAVDEALKFVVPGAEAVSSASLWTDRGMAIYLKEPGRFGVARLAAIRDTYRRLAKN